MKLVFSFLLLCFSCVTVNAQLSVTGGISNNTLQNYLFGPGVKISNLTINCSGLDQYGTFDAKTTQLGLDSGLLITNGNIQDAVGPNNQCCASVTVGTTSNDSCVIAAIGNGQAQSQYDPCIIEFDIVPTCDTFNVSYVFGSEEYNTGVGNYNDIFGFFVTGPNPAGGMYSCQDFALLPGSATIVSINNVNYKANTAYYRDNHAATDPLYQDFQYNGLTVPLTATIPVIACATYHMRVEVIDIGNPTYDSGVFLKFKSLACAQDQVLSVTTSDSVLCSGQNAKLTASGGSNYTWSPATGINSSAGDTIRAAPSSTTTYTVMADEVGTCMSSDSITIRVNPTPIASFNADSLTGCLPLCIGFKDTSTVSGGTITTWHWQFGDGDTSAGQTASHCYKTPGQFDVSLSVYTNAGCSNSKTLNNLITTYVPPQANFSINPVSTNLFNPTINFNNQSTDVYGIKTLTWEFGDGSDTSNVNMVSHTYSDTGEFCTDLIVTDINGCTDTAKRCAEINPLFTLYVPNAFSPNNNGPNNVFEAKGGGMTSFDMWIFDRWGTQIFHSSDINKGWDGTVGDTKCQEDTYIWMIQVNNNTSNNHSYWGRITLIK